MTICLYRGRYRTYFRPPNGSVLPARRVFRRSRTGKYVLNRMIAFMTCVFEDWAVSLHPRCLDSPGFRVRHWIVNREFIHHAVCSCAAESLDDAGIADSSDRTKGWPAELHFRLIVEVRCFD